MHQYRNPIKNPVVFVLSSVAVSVVVAITNYYVIWGLFT